MADSKLTDLERQKLELAGHTMLPADFDKKSRWGNSPLPVLGFFAAYAGLWGFLAYRDRQSANMTFRVGKARLATQFTAGLALTGVAWYKYRADKQDREDRIKSYEHVRH